MRNKMFLSVTAIAGFVLLAVPSKVWANGPGSGKKKDEYKSPGASRKILLNEPLHEVQGEKVTVVHITFPPGWVGGKHYHTGPVYVYVLKGNFVVQEKGKGPQTLPAGTLYREPIGNPMQAHNGSTSETTEILLFQIGHEGEPLMIKTDF